MSAGSGYGMSCGSAGTSQSLSWAAKEFGVSLTETRRIFHWAKEEEGERLRAEGLDPHSGLDPEEAAAWLLREQYRATGVPALRLDGRFAERAALVRAGDSKVSLAEVAAMRALPGYLAVRGAGQCPICERFTGPSTAHDCPGRIANPRAPGGGWPVGPVAAATWWANLDEKEQQRAIESDPVRVGNMDGLPASVRDRVNRTVLEAELATWGNVVQAADAGGPHPLLDQLQLGYRAEFVENARVRLGMLAAVSESLGKARDRRLLVLGTEFPGKAAIAVGDVDSADDVAVLVPGMNGWVTRTLRKHTLNAGRVKHEARRVSARLGQPRRVATVAWVGYYAPSTIQAPFRGHAQAGAEALRDFTLGLRAQRAVTGRPVHLTVVGHSYGSLVTGLASRVGLESDDVVLVGSPGITVGNATELRVPEGHVWTADASGDQVARLGWFGRSPTARGFGAQVLSTQGGQDRIFGGEMRASQGHSDYYSHNTTALRNIALVVCGRAEHARIDRSRSRAV